MATRAVMAARRAKAKVTRVVSDRVDQRRCFFSFLRSGEGEEAAGGATSSAVSRMRGFASVSVMELLRSRRRTPKPSGSGGKYAK